LRWLDFLPTKTWFSRPQDGAESCFEAPKNDPKMIKKNLKKCHFENQKNGNFGNPDVSHPRKI